MIQKDYKLLVIGNLNYNYIINTQEFAGINASQTIDNLQLYDGGAAANVALVAAETVPSAFYSIVGNDFQKSSYFQKLKNHNDCLAILERINDKTSTCFIIVDQNSNQKTYIYNGVLDKFAYLEPPRRYIDRAKIIHIADIPPVLAIKCAQYAHEQGILVSFAPGQNLKSYNRKQMKQMLENITFLFGTEFEINYIYQELNLRILKDYKVPYIISMEDSGSTLIESTIEEQAWYIPETEAKTIDSTGVEDAYIGAFLAAYLKGKDINDCGFYGSATASFITEKYGCQTNIPTVDQINQRLKK